MRIVDFLAGLRLSISDKGVNQALNGEKLGSEKYRKGMKRKSRRM